MRSIAELDDPSQVQRRARTLSVEFWYPRIDGHVDTIRIGLTEVRAADDIRVRFDFERNGYVIEQPTIHEWAMDDLVMDAGWKERAFVPAWAEEGDGNG